ncbi:MULTISPECIES: cytochrome P450 [unclassified Crossiella]|uniref:cytochrome P450 n=1 Tax=unclassified Crossiella TaxID=2620835 RepID=UPI001FFEB47E|nr:MULTISPECIES: cytochrome P450 [unclassified Crossiella]MCK2244586.1 cytochrome P450 [Crossiella sp. S99.2]MCK2258217.1 cytochrome P450 [Crossiella sp. S99.1]
MNNSSAVASLWLRSQLRAGRAATWLLSELGDLVVQLEHPRWRDNPYPLYEQIRQRGPLYRGLSGTWATSSFALCNQVLRDRRFGVRTVDGRVQDGLLGAPVPAPPAGFVELDPPDHTRLRRLAMPAFNPKRLEAYRPRVQAIVDSLLDKVTGRETFDLVQDLGTPLPITVISDLLGIPDAERGAFAEYGEVIIEGFNGVSSMRQAREVTAVTEHLVALFDRLLRERAVEPGDDVISTLATAVGEEKMTARELHGTALLLLVAGFETTVNLIGNGMRALLAHPEQWAQLRAKPELAAAAVEEALRYDSPVQSTSRVAHTEVRLAGQTIKPGQTVVAILAGGNRDPQAYERPERFDITREAGPEHLAFASGIHYCLGARLARIEGEIVFRTLAERLPLLRQAGSPERRDTSAIRGLRTFPVTATVAAQRGQ